MQEELEYLLELSAFDKTIYNLRRANIDLPSRIQHLEKEISDFVKNDPHKNVYTFDMDVSFMSYDVNKNVINMRQENIFDYGHNSIVIFNEDKFKKQWVNLNPMLNWNELKTNYSLKELKNFGNGWKAYEIR